MADKKKWVVEGILEGNLFIPRNDSNFPIKSGKVFLTHYAILEQNLLRKPSKMIFLGLEIPTDVDYVCVAFQEMEAFTRALVIEKKVPISVYIMGMTDKPEEWQEGIGFLEARNFPPCSANWTLMGHLKDPKNRVRRGGGISSAATTVNLSSDLEKRHNAFSAHDSYRSELVKDYIAALDVEHKHPSLAMLYYFKVLERVGKQEYGDLSKGSMAKKTMTALIKDMDNELTANEKSKVTSSVLKCRHIKSEAHLILGGMPTNDELQLCKKMALFFLEKALRSNK